MPASSLDEYIEDEQCIEFGLDEAGEKAAQAGRLNGSGGASGTTGSGAAGAGHRQTGFTVNINRKTYDQRTLDDNYDYNKDDGDQSLLQSLTECMLPGQQGTLERVKSLFPVIDTMVNYRYDKRRYIHTLFNIHYNWIIIAVISVL